MALLTKEQILQSNTVTTEKVAVPEWGGEIILKSLSANDQDVIDSLLLKGKAEGGTYDGYRAVVLSRAIVDEQGKRLFTPEEVAALGEQDKTVIDRLIEKVRNLTPADATAEELAKN